jgi:four helix bundle protein
MLWPKVMGVQRYEDLVCWQLARDLRRRIRAITEYSRVSNDFGFCNDIRRSARSAPANIAEGFRRRKPRQFAHFMTIALGSIDETENHLGEALDACYISDTEHAELLVLIKRVRTASQRLLAYLERRARDNRDPNP